MNNMKYYNDSLAYDFDMFMPKKQEETKSRDNIVALPTPAQRKRTKSAAKSLTASATLIMMAVFILMGICGNIFLRLQINEVNSEINKMKSSISVLDSEKTSLEVEMQRRVSFSNLELQAAQLGMTKLEKKNVKYIRVNDKDIAKNSNGEIITAE